MINSSTFFISTFLYYYEQLSRFALSISLAAAGVGAMSSYILFGLISVSCIVLPFAATLFVYNLDRIAEPSDSDMISNPERTLFVKKYRPVYVVLVISSFTLLVALSIAEGWHVFFAAISFPVFSVLYVVPFLPFKKVRRIKEIPGIKAVYVNLCWSTLVLMTVAIEDRHVDVPVLIFMMSFVFTRMIAGGLLGDLRDREGDKAADVHTLAIMLGEQKTVLLIEVLHVVSVTGAILFILLYPLPYYVCGIIASCFIGYFFHTKIKRQRYAPSVYFDLFDLEYHSYIVFMLLLSCIPEMRMLAFR